MVGVSPSSSAAVALQVNVVEVSTPVLGVMLTEVTTGAELPTVTESEPVSVPPSVSLAVAVQRMVSSGELVEVLSVIEEPDPRLVPSVVLVQA